MLQRYIIICYCNFQHQSSNHHTFSIVTGRKQCVIKEIAVTLKSQKNLITYFKYGYCLPTTIIIRERLLLKRLCSIINV